MLNRPGGIHSLKWKKPASLSSVNPQGNLRLSVRQVLLLWWKAGIGVGQHRGRNDPMVYDTEWYFAERLSVKRNIKPVDPRLLNRKRHRQDSRNSPILISLEKN